MSRFSTEVRASSEFRAALDDVDHGSCRRVSCFPILLFLLFFGLGEQRGVTATPSAYGRDGQCLSGRMR